jgi:hypothetical protein
MEENQIGNLMMKDKKASTIVGEEEGQLNGT